MFVMTVRGFLVAALAWCAMAPAWGGESEVPLRWETDYAAAMDAAEREGTLLVVHFCDLDDSSCDCLDQMLADSVVAQRSLNKCRCVRLPLDAKIVSGGETIRLLEHPAFAGLKSRAGVVVFDFSSEIASERGRVLRTLSLAHKHRARTGEIDSLGNLPLDWTSDYAKAREKAESERRMLLIYFSRADGTGGCKQFEGGHCARQTSCIACSLTSA